MNRRWFSGGLAAAIAVAGVSADARMHHPYRAHRIIPANTGVLDGFTAPAAAYSFRKVRTAYAGFAMKIQRTSDNAFLDVGFTSSGDFNTAAAAAHCAATTCIIDTWYDQSGNVRNALRSGSTASLIFNCLGANPCARSASNPEYLLTGNLTTSATAAISVVANRASGAGYCVFAGRNAVFIQSNAAANTWQISDSGTGNTVTFPASDGWHATVANFAGAATVVRVDQTETTGTVGVTTGLGPIQIAQGAYVAASQCNLMEAVVWDNYTLPPAERVALTDNQRNYWTPLPLDNFATPAAAYSFRKLKSSYAGPAMKLWRASDNAQQDIGFAGNDFDTVAASTFCAATTCRATTWYDQSGLARHTTVAAGTGPTLVLNCIGTLPCLRNNGDSWLQGPSVTPATGTTSFAGVSRVDTSTLTTCALISYGRNQISPHASGATWILYNDNGGVFAPAPLAAWHAGAGSIAGAASVLNIDGVDTAASMPASPLTAAAILVAAGDSVGKPCSHVEAIAWDNYALTPSERVAVVQNQRDYWAPLPLDTFATPAGAYSMRKLKSTYSGPGVRLRRASDNAEQDIGFLGFTSFTGAPIDTAAANAFCAATTCFVRAWYDQSGLARDLVQATTANQPAYVANCTGALPCLEAAALAQTLATAGNQTPVMPVTFAAVANRVTGTDGCQFGAQGNTSNYWGPWYLAPGNWELAAAFVAAAAENTWHAGSAIMNGAASVVRIDATETTGTATGGTTAGVYAGVRGGAATACRITENIRWDNYALTAPERTALQTNQKNFWNTP